MVGSRFSPEIRRALRVDISATLLFTVFAGTGFVARGVFLPVPFVSSAWSFVGLVVARDFLGAAAAPAQAAVVERVYPRAQRGRALGTIRMAGAVLGIALALAAGQLFERVGYRWVFVAAAVLGMAASLRLRGLTVPDVEPGAGGTPAGLGGAWRAVRDDHAFRRLLIASFLFGLGCWIQTPAHPLLLVDVLQVSPSQVGVFAAVAAVATLAGSAGWGWLVDRRTSLEALRAMYLIGALTPLIYYVAWNPWVLVASAITDSLVGIGLELVWMMAVIDVAGARRTAQYVAIGATLAGVRGVAGPLVGGLVIHAFGVHMVYLIAAVLTFSGAWCVTRELASFARFRPGPGRGVYSTP